MTLASNLFETGLYFTYSVMNYAGICVKSVTSLRGKTTCIIINRKKDRKTAKRERERKKERETRKRQRETER